MIRRPVIKFCLEQGIKFLLPLLAFGTGIWSIGVVYYNLSRRSAGWTWLYTLLVGLLLVMTYFSRQSLLLLYLLQLLLLLYFLQLEAVTTFCKTKWQTPWQRMPKVKISNGSCNIINIRDFNYRSVTDYDVRYCEMTVDPARIDSVDLAISYWDGMRSVAHTMLAFNFADGKHLVVSMETRLPQNIRQGFLPGLYKQYGLIMVLGTEEDIFKLRTDFRKEELFLYRTNATPEQAEKLFRKLLCNLTEMHRTPRYYNSIFSNCTTSLVPLLREIDPAIRNDLRMLFNGYSDELLFELGFLRCRQGETFEQLKRRRKVAQYLTNYDNYSAAIRTDI